jgi:hypothetical protein
MSEEPGKYSYDLRAITDQLNHLFTDPDPKLDVDLNYEAFQELKRLADLQISRLHSGQSILRQIDSMIRSWRRSMKHGGASAVQAAHYLDCLQQTRIAIFGEPLANDEGTDEVIVPDIEEAFTEFVTKNQIPKKDLEAARKGFEAAFADDMVLYLKNNVVSVNTVLYIEMTDEQKKEYGFS